LMKPSRLHPTVLPRPNVRKRQGWRHSFHGRASVTRKALRLLKSPVERLDLEVFFELNRISLIVQ
jgi:hypothetical protein